MKPSDIALFVPPLVGTLGKSEIEGAAALIVRACQDHGDAWQAITPKQIGETMKKDIAESKQPFCALMKNPFFQADVWKLVAEGFARWADQPGGACELTDLGLERIKKWSKEKTT